ncbi:polysaccharide lyase [Talaromyces proteolyticus]|uniref:Polysaccharide lyase n=1 Tax=Talaromyces proteolyticus TaxID=1131652 RepID=A0AAD4KLV0_9EURO|nr:polysaccharide lyase [Talaromyces proteolyticus]KAH8691452.1 polysaccharide lyase [Talaromyces proteolyticus]
MFFQSIGTAALAALTLASPTLSTQTFVNTGTLSGWSTQNIEDKGSIISVTNVVYNGTSALKMTQVYDSSWTGRFHSEKIKTQVYKLGDEGFYGFAFRLQENWQSTPAQSFNIGQFIADFTNTGCDDWMPSSMVWVIGDQLATRVKYGSICNQQLKEWKNLKTVTPGEWHTIVINANWQSDNTGYYHMWYDGEKVVNATNLPTMIDDSRAFDFHVGIYANGWHDDKGMKGTQSTREIWIDSVGIGTTFADADPTRIQG